MNLSFVFGGIGRALAVPVYRTYFIGNLVSTMGRWAHRVAAGWLTWELTGSEAWLGIVAFADLFPTVVVPHVSGAITDRVGFAPIIRLSVAVAGAVAALFAALTALDLITVEIIVALTAVIGIAESFAGPARISIVHVLVPRAVASASIALNTASFNAARLVGPALAGPLILTAGPSSVFALNAVSYAIFLGVALRLRLARPEHAAAPLAALPGEVWEAVLVIARDPGIRFMIVLLAATSLLVRPIIEFLPGFAARVYGGGAGELSLLMSTLGFGAMLAGLWLARRARIQGLTRLIVAAYLVTALALFVLAVANVLWFGLVCIALLGFFLLIGNIGAQSLVQHVVASHVRARVMSLYMVVAFGLPALGALAMGWIATAVGLQATVAGGAALAAAVWLWARAHQAPVADRLERAD